MENKNELVMSFDPKTIEHLGIKMYSHLPNAIAELIANSYDACASEVFIHLFDADNENKKIIVQDNGDGMTFDEVNDKFLRIGRNRREEGSSESSCGRIVTGKKGLGKLAFFGIGETITIETCKKEVKTTFILDWDELMSTSGEPYKPKYTTEKCETNNKGTKITLTKLKRKSIFDIVGLSKSLAKLFNFPKEFIVFLQLNDEEIIEIDNKLKYDGIVAEFTWELPTWLKKTELIDYLEHENIVGNIITTEKPIKPGMRGITLFANGRMVNKSEFFGSSESSHFFSYTTGWLDIDFVDNWKYDVISTNRQSLDWENQKTSDLRIFLTKILTEIHKEWRDKRKEKKRKSISEKTSVDIEDWYNKTPEPIQKQIEPIIEKIVDDSELSESETNSIVSSLHALLPEYTYYHYRYIHPEIKEVSQKYYESEDYYNAFLEAIKRYINKVKNKSGTDKEQEYDIVATVFGSNGILKTVKKYERPNGENFKVSTKENIEEGQKFLSMGVVKGARHPVAHEEINDLRESGMFSEKDCLDVLSLLSHLMKRLDDSEKDE